MSAEEKPVLAPHNLPTSLRSSPERTEEVCVQTESLARGHLQTPNSNLPLDLILPVLLGCAYSGTRCQDHICKGLQKYMGRIPGSWLDRQPGWPSLLCGDPSEAGETEGAGTEARAPGSGCGVEGNWEVRGE